MLKLQFSFLLILFATCFTSLAQQQFAVNVQPSSITAVPALHSGAIANYNGKWIFIGGRLDGLHIMQANQAFPINKTNDSIFVVDPVANNYQSASAATLPTDIYQAVVSANMEYYQDGNFLYMIGGYGRQTSQSVWQTFPSLVSVDLSCLLTAVSASSSINSCFRQLTDTNMAVAGGMLEKIDSVYFLVFGHRFDGRYQKPVGGMAMFTQAYTNQVRKFKIHDDGVNLSISDYNAVTDTDNFHRRDLNLLPQVYPNGDYGFTAFGGVFQKNADLPFLTPIDIAMNTIQHQSSFNQNLNQYTTAAIPVYDSTNNYMHSIFFGGMSQYTLDPVTHTLVQDSLVPFVKTISKITRDNSGNLFEYELPVQMPSLLGSNAVFIPDPSISLSHNRIIRLNTLSGNVRVGFIVGGISSDYPNVGDFDPQGMSRPNAIVYEVYFDLTASVNEISLNNEINDLFVYPSPASEKLFIDFSVQKKSVCEISLYSVEGKLMQNIFKPKEIFGTQHLEFSLVGISTGSYFCRVKAGTTVKMVKVLIQ